MGRPEKPDGQEINKGIDKQLVLIANLFVIVSFFIMLAGKKWWRKKATVLIRVSVIFP
jgi:hypothetical protein